MSKIKLAFLFGIAAAAAVIWLIFRPDLAFIDREVDEPFVQTTESVARPLLRGEFMSLAHETRGVATVYHLPGNQRVLRLSDFRTSNGPNVHVYLVKAPDATDKAVRTEGIIDLGVMKGNVGDQTYEIPDGIDLATHRSVSIWCVRFSVNFGKAALSEVR